MLLLRRSELVLYPAAISLVLFIAPILMFVVTYVVSIEEGLANYPFLFLSSTINFTPASNIATFFLAPGCLLVPVIGYVRYLQFNDFCSDTVIRRPKTHDFLARSSLVCSVLCGMGGLGVAAFQVSADFILHFVGAGFFFGFGAFYLLTVVAADIAFPKFGLPYARLFRLSMVVLMVVSVAALGIVLLTWDIRNDDHVISAASLEIVAFICFVSVYASFFWEFRGFELILKVQSADE